ncbi:mitochondrial cardiolipin hydrolase-like, partial [Asbolus verrucosus]
MENAKCREHMYSNTECGDNCSVVLLQTLVKLIAAAKLSIALCMYHLTLKQITDELINARSRGVVVQIITDSVTVKMEHSKIKLLKHKCGFDVRTPSYKNSFMHHKYCVIDATDLNLRKMFLGSLNLTLQGCVANFEFVVITNNPQMIQHYNDEFQLLWNDFEDSENNTL